MRGKTLFFKEIITNSIKHSLSWEASSSSSIQETSALSMDTEGLLPHFQAHGNFPPFFCVRILQFMPPFAEIIFLKDPIYYFPPMTVKNTWYNTISLASRSWRIQVPCVPSPKTLQLIRRTLWSASYLRGFNFVCPFSVSSGGRGGYFRKKSRHY